MNLSWLLPTIKGIPVLMYHSVYPGVEDSLTITPEKLRQQWEWLKQEGYATLSLPQYLDIASGKTTDYPAKAILLTFDDGYLNNLAYVYPLLKELGWQATFFIIADTVDATNKPEEGRWGKMGLKEMQQLDPAVVQLALHGYHHEHFNKASLDEIKAALYKSIEVMDASGLPYHKVLAYPYGARPKDATKLQGMRTAMKEMGINAAFRIGNQVSRIPAPDMLELKRIDICGGDSMEEFKIKLKKGKLRPF